MRRLLTILTILLAVSPAWADFDPDLHAKAEAYQQWIETWHNGSLGALTGAVEFTDATRTEIACLHHQGDSMIWTGMYLGAEALRYMATGDEGALDEVLRVVGYMRTAMAITQTLGYIARYAGEDIPPWNCGQGDDSDWKNHGEGEFAGLYWVDHTSRDQYSGWWWGMVLSYQALEGLPEYADVREGIRDDIIDVIEMLTTNDWNITDQNGEYTGNGAAWIGPMKRIAWLVQAAYVIDTPEIWELLDQQYNLWRPVLAVDIWAGYNKYTEYYGNNLRHLDFQAVFRLWPDRARLEELYDLWMTYNRPYVERTHNPWFDSTHVTGCLRLGVCDPDDYEWIEDDHFNTLGRYWDAPSYRRARTCSDMPLDPLSVLLDDLGNQYPWLNDLINIDPITAEARELDDRHWTDMYWQSTPFEAGCNHGEDQRYVGPGMDYLVGYWMGVYYGILPGGGPFGDDDLIEPDDDDTDDDTDDDIDDDTDDDVSDDDATDDDADDDASDDDASDDDTSTDIPAYGDDDDDDDDGCGC